MINVLIIPPATTPAERMAEAVRELRAAQAQFDQALTWEEVAAACHAINAAQARIALIRADAQGEGRRLRCAG